MSQPFRLSGGLVDRATPRRFTFNGRPYDGYAGDTLASALLGHGVRLVARSFKYHRPRGIVSAGPEEPSALVTVGEGAWTTPNALATMVELEEGLVARSQNHVGPLGFDLMAVNDLFARFLGAGFYYKTFMWPARFWERVYEPLIRRAAGLGGLSGAADPGLYDKGFRHCDLLVIGAGPAGLAAALTAARAGARVILADEDFLPGGRLNAETHRIEDQPGADWAAAAFAELEAAPNVRVMRRSCVMAPLDGGVYAVHERPAGLRGVTTLWRVTAKRALLCAGATERSIVFPGNDRPGVMLAGAVRAYANRFGIATGRRVAVFTNNDNGWRTAADLTAQGVEIAAVVDSRDVDYRPPEGAVRATGAQVVATVGRKRLRAIRLADGTRVAADCLAVSGGWSPNLHLTGHHRGKPVWREDIAAFVPGPDGPPGLAAVGAAAGDLTLAGALGGGAGAARAALDDLGFAAGATPAWDTDVERVAIAPLWRVKAKGRAFVDLQNDVTAKDIALAHREGFESVEHLKRYTTLGMAPDQGRMANLPGLALLADAAGKPIPSVGTTITRPPYAPVPIAAFAGHARGRAFRPIRRTPSHAFAEERGAVFVEAGLWLRAQYFPKAHETHWRESVDREVRAVRSSVGVCDVTTLGKIDVQGRDAGAFLSKLYVNGFAKLRPGRVRYGLMLREDGVAFDDGTVARFSETHYVVTTTTANAVAVYRHMEFCRQCLWPDMDVHLISATEQWAQFAIAGPQSRALLQRVIDPGFDLSSDAFPFMACAKTTVRGAPARLFRISFSGELAYELAVPTRYGDALIRTLMAAGDELGVTPYGTEALGVLRIEKGHAAGPELDGRTTARSLGLDRMISAKKDCIGKVMAQRPALTDPDAPVMVGLRAVDAGAALSAGAHLIVIGGEEHWADDRGWVSSACYSPTLERPIALGFLKRGDKRMGETLIAADPVRGRRTVVTVCSPHFVDPDGMRLHG